MRRKNNRFTTFAGLIIITVILLGVGYQSGMLRILTSIVMFPIKPAAGALTDGTEAVSGLGADRQTLQELQDHNRELERTVAQLQIEIVRLREIERDYFRLSGIVDYAAENPDQTYITADVIARDTSSYLRWIIINRGARDGIQIGDPVITDLGLVGRVQDIASNSAWILLANDPSSVINAWLQTAQAEGTISGRLQGGLRMDTIPPSAVVGVGDLVLTSGLGGSFPANIVIGQVTSVRSQQAALFQDAEVRPTVDFNNLTIVSVIITFDPVDPSLFNNTIDERQPEGP